MFSWCNKAVKAALLLFIVFLVMSKSKLVFAQCSIYGCPNCSTCNVSTQLCVACPAAGTCSTACGTAPYYYNSGCCTQLYCPGNLDSSPPTVPAGTAVTFTPDPTCRDTYTATYSWGASIDVGCWGLHSTPYWAQGSSDSGFGSVLYGWNNTWVSASPRSQTTVSAYPPGTTLYFHVKARDAADNQSNWSATSTVVVPTPSLYPTISVSGPLSEDINRTCYPMSLLRDLTLEPIIAPALGVTPICTMPTTDTYKCNFIIDNQKGNCVSQNIVVTMNATYSGYGSIGWRTGTGGGECTGYPVSRSYTIGDTESNIPIYLTYNTILPTAIPTITPGGPTITPTDVPTPTITPGGPTITPTDTPIPTPTITPGGPTITPTDTPIPTPTSIIIPTPAYAAGWFKLKDTSFNSRMSSRQDYVPRTLQKYDTTDDDDISTHHIMIGNSGVLVQNDPLLPGSNAYESGEIQYSTNNWYTNGYASISNISYSKYIDYVKARKDFTTISGTVTGSSFPANGIYHFVGDVTLDPTWFDGKNIVFVVEGIATINTPTFIPTSGSVAILSSVIDIDPSVTEIDAILIGAQVSTGNSDVNPLKIKGNLIDEESGGMILGRSRANATKPSLFVIFDTQMYLNVLPYLSVSTYDWRQIQ